MSLLANQVVINTKYICFCVSIIIVTYYSYQNNRKRENEHDTDDKICRLLIRI